MNAPAPVPARAELAERVAALVAAFIAIARTRMADLPVCNPALRVEAIGFEAQADGEGGHAVGILVTPWFMNLVRLPLRHDASAAGAGHTQVHTLGGQRFEFIGAHEPAFGAFAACSLFSPVFEFADPANARDTARAVLAELRRPEPATVPAPAAAAVTTPDPASPPVAPARRSFLFGRGVSSEPRREAAP